MNKRHNTKTYIATDEFKIFKKLKALYFSAIKLPSHIIDDILNIKLEHYKLPEESKTKHQRLSEIELLWQLFIATNPNYPQGQFTESNNSELSQYDYDAEDDASQMGSFATIYNDNASLSSDCSLYDDTYSDDVETISNTSTEVHQSDSCGDLLFFEMQDGVIN